jgi:hypothetical protein
MFDTIIEEHGVYKVNSYVEVGTVVKKGVEHKNVDMQKFHDF